MSLRGRLTDRPPLVHLLGPGCDGPAEQITPVMLSAGSLDTSGPLFTSFCSDLICNVVLPTAHKGVQLGGCGASLGGYLCRYTKH